MLCLSSFELFSRWVPLINRDLTKPRLRQRQKNNGFNEQKNNFARASRFLVHFFAFTAQLRCEMTKF